MSYNDFLMLFGARFVSLLVAVVVVLVIAGLALRWTSDAEAKFWIRRVRLVILLVLVGGFAISLFTGASVNLVPRSVIDRSAGDESKAALERRIEQGDKH
jgi:hypothetical protein